MTRVARLGLLAVLATCLGLGTADAFGGLFVGAGDGLLVSDGGQIVIVRDGTRTVLVVQPRYAGPPDAFALVIPVPASTQERDVTALAPETLATVERTSAPRLVEYVEQDPCAPAADAAPAPAAPRDPDDDITIEPHVAAREYQISMLAAKDASALAAWLAREKLQLPAGAEPVVQSYLERGMKLVVAKVDPAKLSFTDGRAVLSPLRVQYDSAELVVPIRIGLANSPGAQDVIVHVFAPGQRYEVANQRNVTIPTNLIVKREVRERFSAFYATLLDAMLEHHPDAVVTEHAGEVDGALGDDRRYVLTRLHARYSKAIEADLVLRPAPAIAGGRERVVATGRLEDGAQAVAENAFQARYVIRRPWRGPLTCTSPVRGRWIADAAGARTAVDLALAPRGALDLAAVLTHDVPEVAVAVAGGGSALPPSTVLATSAGSRDGCRVTTGDGSGAFVIVALLVLVRRRPR